MPRETVTTRRTDEPEVRDALSLIGRSITRRECAKCGVVIGEAHSDECPVDRHAPIVEVEYVRAADCQGAVDLLIEALPSVFDWAVEGNDNAAKLNQRINDYLDRVRPGWDATTEGQ